MVFRGGFRAVSDGNDCRVKGPLYKYPLFCIGGQIGPLVLHLIVATNQPTRTIGDYRLIYQRNNIGTHGHITKLKATFYFGTYVSFRKYESIVAVIIRPPQKTIVIAFNGLDFHTKDNGLVLTASEVRFESSSLPLLPRWCPGYAARTRFSIEYDGPTLGQKICC
ncbi:unnamed protein product [Haemonchus placei]|uniref:CUB domain-containing protein n=1 Tax=Haemonchus placei TaxID=6290 RepID=A0A0N4VSI6_HAEPC|nr:unnamed protein product [Haemonchus placei]